MLLLKGKLIYRNLNTTYTNIEQFLTGLRKDRFTGYCTVGFWEYDAVLFLVEGKILSGREEQGIRAKNVQSGDIAVANIIKKGQEKGGELNAYALSMEQVTMLIEAMDTTPKYEDLSTDLTSLDKLIALLKKETLSGYIEVLLEEDAGFANLFFLDGEQIEAIFAPPDNRMIGEVVSLEELMALCEKHGAVFNVYQNTLATAVQGKGQLLQGSLPPEAIKLFESILAHLEPEVDAVSKAGTFETTFKTVLPQIADKYEFLDPFLGDFRYAKQSLSYKGDASYKEFVDGLCDGINSTFVSLLATIPKTTLLPRISAAMEPVSAQYSELIEQLQLETRIPEIFQDYTFIKERESSETGQTQSRSVLNLQGVGVSEIGNDSILREFYRIISIIVKKYSTESGHVIQYGSLKKSSEYQQYQTATVLLQNIEVASLKNHNDAIAFWLNLYNFLAIDGILKFGVTNVQETKGFFTKTSYRLGEYVFSLDEIEHGILRNNQRRPYSIFRSFSGTDPRKAFCSQQLENRIHCCLVCGTKSGPALRVYAPNQVEKQLTQAANDFLTSEKGIRINQEKQEILLNRAFYWYKKDFEQKGKTIIDFLITYLEEPGIKQFIAQNRSTLKLRFMDYDWSLNG